MPMLTARNAEDDIIRGLDLGADDFPTKTFSIRGLVARLHSITRNRRREKECGSGSIEPPADCEHLTYLDDAASIVASSS
jgi:DNA-binding response OmpR family regulator